MISKKIKYLIGGILLVVFLIGFVFWRTHRVEQKYKEMTIATGDVHKIVNVDAEIVPDIYADISSELPILIDWVGVKENERVKKGQELLRLNQDSLNAQVKYAELALQRSELAEKKARRKWDSLKPEERESFKKATQQARETLREVYAQAEKTVITSPIDGVVITQNAQVGEVAKGTLMKIIDPNSLYLQAMIPEVDVSKIHNGDPVFVSFDAYPNKIVDGKISSINVSSTVEENNTYFKATVDIQNKNNLKILNGMNADVDIEIEHRKDVTVVPRNWIEKDDDGYYVYILNPNRHGSDKKPFVKKYFKVGLVGKDNVEVVSGLKVGDKIIKMVE